MLVTLFEDNSISQISTKSAVNNSRIKADSLRQNENLLLNDDRVYSHIIQLLYFGFIHLRYFNK